MNRLPDNRRACELCPAPLRLIEPETAIIISLKPAQRAHLAELLSKGCCGADGPHACSECRALSKVLLG